MYIKGMVDECDFSGKRYDQKVEGVWVLSRGASGRVCCVMFAGPEYVEQAGLEVSTREEAEAWAKDHPTGSVDF